jgi:2-polyprenyl-3-methyl-5-hydroxy-6-metoxy-1,4-benzoquinol methylase
MAAKAKSKPTKRATRETSAPVLRQALLRKVPHRLEAKAELLLPAVPGLVDHYVQGLNATWCVLGRHFAPFELDYLRKVLGDALKQAFEDSPYSRVRVTYETDPPPKTTLTWQVAVRHSTIESEYAQWVAERTAPLFGLYPDMKVMDLARSLGRPSEVAVLDVGAGTGRNTIALAREGFVTDAVELAPALAQVLRQEVAKENLHVQVYEGNVLDPALPVPQGKYHLVLLAEVVASHFRTTQQVRELFEAANRMLAPGGLLLFSTFLALEGYKPDEVARAFSQVMWCCLFTRREIQEAASGLPFEGIADESAREYERSRLPEDQWPPTGWYEAWTAGQDLFDLAASKCPLELRWLTYRKLS